MGPVGSAGAVNPVSAVRPGHSVRGAGGADSVTGDVDSVPGGDDSVPGGVDSVTGGADSVPGGVDLVILEGGVGTGAAEQWLGRVRHAIVLDTVERVLETGAFPRLIVATDDVRLATALEEFNDRLTARVAVDLAPSDGRPFHWGRRLQALVQKWNLERVVVMGGASAPLIGRRDVDGMVRRLRRAGAGVWANNIHSADIIAFHPASVLNGSDPPGTDNALPFWLYERAGLPLGHLPRTLGLTFDVDTPTDALILALHAAAGPRVRRLLAGHPRLQALREARSVLLDRTREAWFAGRISGRQLRFLDDRTRCRLRVFSEERGMKSLGREERGEVVSLLAGWIEAVGPESFFEQLARCCSAAFIDTRVLFAHGGRTVDAADRFASDLGDVEAIRDPWVRRFTAAAQAAPIPVILGGHSLVTGGVWALLDSASAPHGSVPVP